MNKGFYETRQWKELRYRVLRDSGAKCQCCGRGRQDGVRIHVDHIKPRSKFPDLELEYSNLQVLCEDCNLGKSNKDETDWRDAPKHEDGLERIPAIQYQLSMLLFQFPSAASRLIHRLREELRGCSIHPDVEDLLDAIRDAPGFYLRDDLPVLGFFGVPPRKCELLCRTEEIAEREMLTAAKKIAAEHGPGRRLDELIFESSRRPLTEEESAEFSSLICSMRASK